MFMRKYNLFILLTALMAERLTSVRGRFGVQISDRPNLIQRCKRHRFNIYASSCVALALWRGDGHRQLVTCFGEIRSV